MKGFKLLRPGVKMMLRPSVLATALLARKYTLAVNAKVPVAKRKPLKWVDWLFGLNDLVC
jgi:hypothetical protein